MIVEANYALPFSWPVRSMSFNHDGKLIASSSEDLVIDIVSVTFVNC